MLEDLDEHNLRDHLTALADGELDAAQTAAVWSYLANHPGGPAALRWMAEQQNLTVAVRNTAAIHTPPGLSERITAIIADEAAPAPSAPIKLRSTMPRRIAYALALAAAVAIGVTVTTYFDRAAPSSGLPSAVLPTDLIVMAGRVHGECARLPEHLHNARFSEADSNLAELTRNDLGPAANTAAGVPDLTSAGFRFIGAGPCPASTFHTVHLLYRTTRPSGLAAVSLFVQADAGQYPLLKNDRVYRVSSPISPFPMMAWRGNKVIYFLLADDDRAEASVLQTIHPTPPEAIVTTAG